MRLYATEQDGAPGREDGILLPKADLSPRFWHDFVVERIDVRRHVRSVVPLGSRDHRVRLPLDHPRGAAQRRRRLGSWASPRGEPDAFTPEHESIVLALADLVAAALEHERMWNEEHRRRERGDALERLLPTLAKSMDVREIFQQISQVTQGVIPHDFVGLAFLNAEGDALTDPRALRRQPLAPARAAGVAGVSRLARERLLHRARRLGRRPRDASRATDVCTPRIKARPLREKSSWIRLVSGSSRRGASVPGSRCPLRSQGEIVGTMLFGSQRPDAYEPCDADLARRVADHVALALRLSAHGRRAAPRRAGGASTPPRWRAASSPLTTRDRRDQRLRPRRRRVPAWKDALAPAREPAGRAETTVLLLGESGTGKEVIARYDPPRVARAPDGPFVALNCAALPEHLLESELFGHERGAFTGAAHGKPGQIELAAGRRALPRRGRRDEPVRAGQAPARAPGARVPARRRHATLDRRRARHRRDQPRPAGRDRARHVPRGPLLPAAGVRDPAAAAARAARRHPAAERGVPRGPAPRLRAPARGHLARGARAPAAPTRGPATCASCATSSSARRSCATAASSAPSTSRSAPARDPPSPAPAPAVTPTVSRVPEAPSATDLPRAERAMVERALKEARFNKSKAARALGLTRTQLYVRLRRHGLG